MTQSPIPERSLDRQFVLDEDEYTAALSQIIARDFFPSLAHLDATNEYLEALHTKDPHLIGASVRRLENLATPLPPSAHLFPSQTPSRTPHGLSIDTPLRSLDGEAPRKRPKFDTELSLDAFQARYTSEDNSSFTRILENENQTRREKWVWAWDAQKRVEAQQDRLICSRERMLIEAPPIAGVRAKFKIEPPTPMGLLTGGEEVEDGDDEEGARSTTTQSAGKELILSDTKEREETDVMAPKKDTRHAGVDGWQFKARNSLMFPPDADVSPHQLLARSEVQNDPKVIKYSNTRLEDSSDAKGTSCPPSPTRSRIEAAITGTPYRQKSPIDRFSLVANLPSPTAADLGPTAVKQLMTWGTLNATPRIISQSDDPGDGSVPNTSFRLPAISHREMISHKLSNKASKSLRAKAGLLGFTPGIGKSTSAGRKKGDMGPPSWTPRSQAAGSLTPAARRLLDRTTVGTAAARRAEVMERSSCWKSVKGKEKDLNHVRWTPTPKQ